MTFKPNEYQLLVVRHLLDHGARFLVVGGVVRQIHTGELTRDLDLWADISETNKVRLTKALDAWVDNYPSHVPRIVVLREDENEAGRLFDEFFLDLPPLCDDCVSLRGLSRRGYYMPKGECESVADTIAVFLKFFEEWKKHATLLGIVTMMESWEVSAEEACSAMGWKMPDL